MLMAHVVGPRRNLKNFKNMDFHHFGNFEDLFQMFWEWQKFEIISLAILEIGNDLNQTVISISSFKMY